MTARRQPFTYGTGILLALLGLPPIPLISQSVEFRQTSVPVGIVDETATVQVGDIVDTVSAPNTNSGFTFVEWTLNGLRAEDITGFSPNPVRFEVTGPVDAVAIYMDSSEDADGDGLPDWWERRYFSDTSATFSGSPDLDPFSNAEEFLRETRPLVHDAHENGGLSRSRSASLYVIQDTSWVRLFEGSQPAGVIQSRRLVLRDEPVDLVTPPDPFSGYRFTGWLENGTRFDPTWAAQPISIVPGGDRSLVARYHPETENTDGDAIPDWQEWLTYESLVNDETDDPEGDGFDWAEEIRRGQSTLVFDTFVNGGASRSRGRLIYVNTLGQLEFRQTSDPFSIIESTDHIAQGTIVETERLAGSLV